MLRRAKEGLPVEDAVVMTGPGRTPAVTKPPTIIEPHQAQSRIPDRVRETAVATAGVSDAQDRLKLFEEFQNTVSAKKTEIIEDNKRLLKQAYEKAKSLGDETANLREEVSMLNYIT